MNLLRGRVWKKLRDNGETIINPILSDRLLMQALNFQDMELQENRWWSRKLKKMKISVDIKYSTCYSTYRTKEEMKFHSYEFEFDSFILS